MEREEENDVVCLDESFFINDNYQLTTFTFGPQVLELYCLQSASTDFDLTGQMVWPGAELLNDYLSKNSDMLRGCSVIELGSGVGVTGILCSRFCSEVTMTDHNDEVLKILTRNIELHDSSKSSVCSAELKSEKLEWGNSEQLNYILQKHPEGFDLVLGADIYILIYIIHLLLAAFSFFSYCYLPILNMPFTQVSCLIGNEPFQLIWLWLTVLFVSIALMSSRKSHYSQNPSWTFSPFLRKASLVLSKTS